VTALYFEKAKRRVQWTHTFGGVCVPHTTMYESSPRMVEADKPDVWARRIRPARSLDVNEADIDKSPELSWKGVRKRTLMSCDRGHLRQIDAC